MISVILPVKNEPNLPDFLIRLHTVLEKLNTSYEVIIAMGDREDNWADPPEHPNQRVIKTYGDSLERSILAGFSFSKGELLVVCDVDNYHPVSAIPLMVTRLAQYEMVAGSRFISGGRLNMSPFRTFISKFFRSCARSYGSRLSDPMTGFFGIRKEVIDKVTFKPYIWKVALEIEMKSRPTLYEIPIVPQPRMAGISKSSIKIGLKLMRDMISG